MFNNTNLSDNKVCASDLLAARAEIWLLNKHLSSANTAIDNLEHLMKNLIDQQSSILKDLYDLKQCNCKLQEECRQDREHHTMERYALIRELHDVKVVLNNRTTALEKALKRSTELDNEVQTANENVYVMEKYCRIMSKKLAIEHENVNNINANEDSSSQE